MKLSAARIVMVTLPRRRRWRQHEARSSYSGRWTTYVSIGVHLQWKCSTSPIRRVSWTPTAFGRI